MVTQGRIRGWADEAGRWGADGWARRLVIGTFGWPPETGLAPELSLARFLLGAAGTGDSEPGVAVAIERFWAHLKATLPEAGFLAASLWLERLLGEATSPALRRLRQRIAGEVSPKASACASTT